MHKVIIFLLFSTLLLSVFGCSSEESNLPAHTVASNTSLAPKDGRRIQINSNNTALTKKECISLIEGYRKKAAPEGQVSVYKPSKVLNGSLAPWCVENFDGRGIIFNDNMF